MLKILHWDGSGFWIWYRQLERGTFQLQAEWTCSGMVHIHGI
jgi:hypothetical protein